MKNYLILPVLLLILGFQSCGSLTTSNNTPVVKVVPVVNDSQNDLYVRANIWMVGAFNDAKSVVQFKDKKSGTITGKYYLSPIWNANDHGPVQDAYALIMIQVKDGASKITIVPEEFNYMKGNPYTLYDEDRANDKISALIASFEESIKKQDNSDW
ncbi:MAG: DUF4468 domain-containing protein [Gillisia sp.]|nr:DUF4468 domain-containing protein [Gillisia sp.]